MEGVATAIRAALQTGEPRAKVMAARRVARDWRLGRLEQRFDAAMPDRPTWSAELELLEPKRMPKRGRGGSLKNRVALWHSLAHIEFVAIDLALDMAGRFGADMGPEFVGDFLSIAAEEAMHFALIERHLASLGIHYGSLPVHGGLWEAAHETRHDVSARLAVVPMVLEARGLDVTPTMLERVRAAGDETGGRILERILDDEIRHVAIGTKHFHETSLARGELPREMWQNLVKTHFRGALKPPFNDSARHAAGLSRSWYAGVA
jgi:uncharacterized ferritin-like protein (DUF455 family)